jgi:hypothetical protein
MTMVVGHETPCARIPKAPLTLRHCVAHASLTVARRLALTSPQLGDDSAMKEEVKCDLPTL